MCARLKALLKRCNLGEEQVGIAIGLGICTSSDRNLFFRGGPCIFPEVGDALEEVHGGSFVLRRDERVIQGLVPFRTLEGMHDVTALFAVAVGSKLAFTYSKKMFKSGDIVAWVVLKTGHWCHDYDCHSL